MSNCIHRGLKLLLLSASLILSIALLAAACSGGDDGDGDSATTPAADATSTDGADNAGPVSFDISMGDNFFEANVLVVSPGQQVTIDLTNDGAAVHNMHIAGADNEYSLAFCEVGGEEPCSDPELFQPGDTGTLVWTAPDATGLINFRCDFHAVEMIGTISVE